MNVQPTSADSADDYGYCAEHISPRSTASPYEFNAPPLALPNSLWCMGPLKNVFIDTSALVLDIDSVPLLQSSKLDCSTAGYCEELYEHFDHLESAMAVDPMYLDRHTHVSMSLRASMVNAMVSCF